VFGNGLWHEILPDGSLKVMDPQPD